LDELLVTDPNALYVFDRGYVDYKKWDDYCDAGIRFVTRIKDNFIINIIDEKPVDGTNMTESIVLLGDPKKTIMRHQLRLIHTVDSKGTPVVILTNDFKLSALEISETYRSRWKIELFFKWIKQHLKVKKFYGQSANAAYSQIWLALITYCLLLLTQINLKTKKSLLDIQRLLKDNLFKPINFFLAILRRQSTKTSRGRRKINHEEQFEQLLLQVEYGDILFMAAYGLKLNCL
jgi:transposase